MNSFLVLLDKLGREEAVPSTPRLRVFKLEPGEIPVQDRLTPPPRRVPGADLPLQAGQPCPERARRVGS